MRDDIAQDEVNIAQDEVNQGALQCAVDKLQNENISGRSLKTWRVNHVEIILWSEAFRRRKEGKPGRSVNRH